MRGRRVGSDTAGLPFIEMGRAEDRIGTGTRTGIRTGTGMVQGREMDTRYEYRSPRYTDSAYSIGRLRAS